MALEGPDHSGEMLVEEERRGVALAVSQAHGGEPRHGHECEGGGR